MANDYPLPKFHNLVDWDGTKIRFMEITSLTDKGEVIDFRNADRKDFSKIKMPGLRKFSNITLKRGKIEDDKKFEDWLDEISNDKDKKRNLVFELFNESNELLITLKVRRAFPVKITAPDLKSEGNEVDIESIEITHGGLRLISKRKKEHHK
jgi:phage tail-like protein